MSKRLGYVLLALSVAQVLTNTGFLIMTFVILRTMLSELGY